MSEPILSPLCAASNEPDGINLGALRERPVSTGHVTTEPAGLSMWERSRSIADGLEQPELVAARFPDPHPPTDSWNLLDVAAARTPGSLAGGDGALQVGYLDRVHRVWPGVSRR